MNSSKATEFRELHFSDQKEARSLTYFNLKYWMCLLVWACGPLRIPQDVSELCIVFKVVLLKGFGFWNTGTMW